MCLTEAQKHIDLLWKPKAKVSVGVLRAVFGCNDSSAVPIFCEILPRTIHLCIWVKWFPVQEQKGTIQFNESTFRIPSAIA